VRAGFAARTPSGKDVIVEAVTAYDDGATSGAAGRRRSKSGAARNVRQEYKDPPREYFLMQ